MTFGNNPREYPDEWAAKAEGKPGALPMYISNNVLADPSGAELQLKGILAQRSKQLNAEFEILSTVEEVEGGYAMLVVQKPRRRW